MTREEFLELYFNGDPLSGFDLSGIDLSEESLSDIDLTGANLSNANLTGINFRNTNFTDANLSNANFTNADLSDAILTNANLAGAVFVRTKLEGTGFEHLRQEKQLDLKRDITHTTYLEAPRRKMEGHGRLKLNDFGRQYGGTSARFADIQIRLEPISSGDTAGATQVIDAARSVVYKNTVADTVVKAKFMEGVPEGIGASVGILIGAPLANVRVTAVDGQMHEINSSKEDFKTATIMALINAMESGGTMGMNILEPVYKLSILVTNETMEEVITAISNNQGCHVGTDSDDDGNQFFMATLPYRNFARFEAAIKNATGKDARFSAQFDHYAEVPPQDVEALKAQHQK